MHCANRSLYSFGLKYSIVMAFATNSAIAYLSARGKIIHQSGAVKFLLSFQWRLNLLGAILIDLKARF
jgi:hypothetical protein